MENDILNDNNFQDDLPLYNKIYSKNDFINEKYSNNKSFEIKKQNLNGRWNKDEHIRFIKGCLLYGNNWKKVKNYVKTRTRGQIRSHAQKYLIKLNKKYKKINFNDKIFQDFSFNNNIIKNYVNHFNLYDMEKIEKIILFIFKKYNCDSFDNYNYFNNYEKIDFDDFDFSDNLKKEKEQIFEILKIPKKKKKIENEEEKKTNLNEKLLNLFLGNKRNSSKTKINYDEMYHNLNGLNNFGIEPNQMIEIEKFINFCLDSNDPLDLLNLFNYFDTNNLISNQYNLIEQKIFPSSIIDNNLFYLMNNNYSNDKNNQCNNDIKTSSSTSIDNDKFNLNFNQNFYGDYNKINNGKTENFFVNNYNSSLLNHNYFNSNFNSQNQNYFYGNGFQNQ